MARKITISYGEKTIIDKDFMVSPESGTINMNDVEAFFSGDINILSSVGGDVYYGETKLAELSDENNEVTLLTKEK